MKGLSLVHFKRIGPYGIVLLLLPAIAAAQDAADFFRQNCVSCHTIGGGRLTGPDLKDVLTRKDRAWLTQSPSSESSAWAASAKAAAPRVSDAISSAASPPER